MSWKGLGIPLSEFLGGLVALRVALPIESLVLSAAGLALTVLGLHGLTRRMSPPRPRPYA